MPLSTFREARGDARRAAHTATEKRCRPHASFHFKKLSGAIKPWRRAENLERWRNRRERARARPSVCLRVLAMHWYYADTNGDGRSDGECVHSKEGAWDANTGNGYYGGLQADIDFQLAYGPEFYRAHGTANNWKPWQQIVMGYRGHKARGWYPWPNTARACGLL